MGVFRGHVRALIPRGKPRFQGNSKPNRDICTRTFIVVSISHCCANGDMNIRAIDGRGNGDVYMG